MFLRLASVRLSIVVRSGARLVLNEGYFGSDEAADQPGGFTLHFCDGFRCQSTPGILPFYLSENVVHVGVLRVDDFDI